MSQLKETLQKLLVVAASFPFPVGSVHTAAMKSNPVLPQSAENSGDICIITALLGIQVHSPLVPEVAMGLGRFEEDSWTTGHRHLSIFSEGKS